MICADFSRSGGSSRTSHRESAMRNPSHQLNDEIRSKGHAKLAGSSAPSGVSHAQIALRTPSASVRRGIAAAISCHSCKNTKYASQLHLSPRAAPEEHRPERRLFRQIAQIIVARASVRVDQPGIAAVSACVVRAATMMRSAVPPSSTKVFLPLSV